MRIEIVARRLLSKTILEKCAKKWELNKCARVSFFIKKDPKYSCFSVNFLIIFRTVFSLFHITLVDGCFCRGYYWQSSVKFDNHSEYWYKKKTYFLRYSQCHTEFSDNTAYIWYNRYFILNYLVLLLKNGLLEMFREKKKVLKNSLRFIILNLLRFYKKKLK